MPPSEIRITIPIEVLKGSLSACDHAEHTISELYNQARRDGIPERAYLRAWLRHAALCIQHWMLADPGLEEFWRTETARSTQRALDRAIQPSSTKPLSIKEIKDLF